MRPFLAFDTATDHLALAIGDLDDPGAVLAADDFPAPRAANTVVLVAVERLLDSIGLEPSALAAVAVGRGPGSFTGVRIGVATAKGLAHGRGVPLVGFGTLDAVARRIPAEGLVGVLGDAMRGEVYPVLYRVHAGSWQRLGEDRVSFPAHVAAEWAGLGERIVLTGAALAKYRDTFASALGECAGFAPDRQWVPDGPSLIAAAWARSGEGSLRDVASARTASHPRLLLPAYTRLSDAEEAERLRLGGAPGVPNTGVAGPNPGGA